MNILLYGNAPFVGSGYGTQIKLFGSRLRSLGHRVAFGSYYGLVGGRLQIDGMPVYPESRGDEILVHHARDFFGGDPRDGLVIAVTDIWTMQVATLKQLRVACWVPVDHEPCQPPTVNTLRDAGVLPIAMSRFGERMLGDAGFTLDKLTASSGKNGHGLKPVYVPHGFDGAVLTERDRDECRDFFKLPRDAYVVGMVAANKGPRKSFPQAIRAFGRFYRRHPEARLYLHTWLGVDHDGYDLRALLEQELGEQAAKEAVLVANQYEYDAGLIGSDYLAKAYSAMDVLLNPARGEGFGVPIIEAQACGTPVIVSDFSAMPELVGAGFKVPGEQIYTQLGSWQLLPFIDAIEDALETHHAMTPAERQDMRVRAAEFAAPYDADLVTQDHWAPALAEIERRLPKTPAVAGAKKAKRKGKR